MPAKQRLRLDKKERLFPSPNHPGQEHQKKPVRFPVDRALYLSPENDQLVSQQRVFRKEFGFPSGQIGEYAKHKGGRWWFNPAQKTFLKRMKAETDTLFDGGEYTQHELNLSFVKMGALEDEYKQHGPCLLYSPLTSFGKEACSIVRNMPIFRTDDLSSQHRQLQRLANETGLAITVCHLPPATSKWNKIEHRLFSYISINWRGKPLLSLETIIGLISHTTTEEGLTVTAVKDATIYPTGIKVSDEEMAKLNITREPFHGEWNYTIRPL